MILRDMPDLEAALDAESYEWLERERPDLIRPLLAEIQRGATADEIRRVAEQHTDRPKIAKRLEQAAAHMAREARAHNDAGRRAVVQ